MKHIKKILILIIVLISFSCTSPSQKCDYTNAYIKFMQVGTNVILADTTIKDCFYLKVFNKSLNGYEMVGNLDKISVSYYLEKTEGILDFLDIKIDESKIRFRRNKGHNIFIINKNNKLSFIFGDLKDAKIKGTLVFTK